MERMDDRMPVTTMDGVICAAKSAAVLSGVQGTVWLMGRRWVT